MPKEQGLALPPLDQDPPDTKLCLQYQMAIRSLMYAMIKTRPDLTLSISKLSQYLSNSRGIHWNAIKQVLQYLRGSLNNRITYQAKNNQPHLIEYTDSSWAGNKNT